MPTKEQMEEMFQIASAAMQINDFVEENIGDEAISRKALGLAYMSACCAADVDEAEMCTTIMRMRRQAERGKEEKSDEAH